MFDIVLPIKAVLVGTFTGAVVAWWTIRRTRSSLSRSACWSWAVGAGILAAGGTIEQWPHWPPLEDRARFLTFLVPLTLAVETLATAVPSTGIAWTVRLALAAIVAPILLHNSIYLVDLNGRNSAAWSYSQATIVLSGLTALLTLIWAMLSRLQSRTSMRTVLGVLALDAWATATTVMLSGYYGAGLLGLGLAGAIAGTWLASCFVEPQSPRNGSLGMSVIGIFAVVLMGRLFGALSTALAACLLLTPLLAWTAELPAMRRLAPGWRGTWRLAFVAIPLIVVVLFAQRQFKEASTARSRMPETRTVLDQTEK